MADSKTIELEHLGLSERWRAEAVAAAPYAGEMLTYLRGLLVEPSHPGIRQCAQKLIEQIDVTVSCAHRNFTLDR